jgi:nicotinate-nucleotide pyrophosphorylase (carboxylating)
MLKRMSKEFHQLVWDDRLQRDCWAILRLALEEDIGTLGDWTTKALVAEDAEGRANVVARQPGVMAGLQAVKLILETVEPHLRWLPQAEDGQHITNGQCVGTVEGPARGLLGAERILLNFLGRLSGIATLTNRYVEAISGTSARIYDTRKTTPGWRRLEKYAVRCGGGRNHRGGLDEAVLIKDNHLALGNRSADPGRHFTPADAVAQARRFIAQRADDSKMLVEIEVDTLEQLDAVLPVRPDIVLLDNMSLEQLSEAVKRRNAVDPSIELEASGGIDLSSVRRIAQTGVDRISVGSLTHSATSLDFGLDWAE